MGAGPSLPTTLTHEKLFELTRDTRGLMNILLEYMLKEVTVRDFLALSNPDQCKKYIVFMANNLYKFFYELQIMPTRDKRGVIAFRPVKELVSPPEAVEQEKQSLCLILAYYYARIFQIYGALALTLIDDVTYASETGILTMMGDARKIGLLPPGYRPFTSFGGADNTLQGGVITYGQLQIFNFLRSYLLDEEDSKKGFNTIYTGEGNSRAEIYFKRQLILTKVRQEDRSSEYQTGIFSIGYYGAAKYATLEVFAKKEGIGSPNIRFEIGKLRYYKKGSTILTVIDIPIEILPKKYVIIVPELRVGSTLYRIKDTNSTISDFLTDFFNKLVPYIKSLSEGDEILSTKYTTSRSTIASEIGTPDELRMGRIIQNLTITKPLGHCIARALQLLRNVPFGREPVVSSICKAKFLATASGLSRSGLPEPGKSLDESPGMAALAQLFYDTIKIGSPKLEISIKPGPDGKSTFDQYTLFMKNMARLFGDTKTTDILQQTGLRGIFNKRDKQLCGSKTENILVPPKTAQNLYQYVNKLFKIQFEHAGKCGAIFKMLFDIQRDKASGRYRISLSSSIIKKGFSEIERINSLARKLLIDYYSNCEQTYVIGMGIVLKNTAASPQPSHPSLPIPTPKIVTPGTIPSTI